jgi:D-glycero-D-manno-heptose 1,7-bisphosphate phosphatase
MSQNILSKALFIDRDGIINEDTAYPYKAEHIRFNEEIFPLCRLAAEKGYLLIVITNQAGVAKGKFTEADVQKLHAWMAEEFKKRGITIDRFYYCPHHLEARVPEYMYNCNCRKPRPGMVLQAMKDFNIDIKKSLVVGDKHSDRIELPGLRSVIVKSGYTGEEYDVEEISKVAGYL